MNKKELIHKLVKTLEQMERYLVFTVFYTYEDFVSKSFCPAFEFEDYYYEIQVDNSLELQVLRWRKESGSNEKGDELFISEIEELTQELSISWAEYNLENNLDDSRFKCEKDKNLIYDSLTNKDICNSYDPEITILLINLLNKHYENINR